MVNNNQIVQREYFSVKELAVYSGISERTLWDLLKNPVNPIPCFRMGSTGRIVRVKKTDFDDWAKKQKEVNCTKIDQLVNDVLGCM